MVDVKTLKPGDRVQITATRVGTRWNNHGKMDKYLGMVMTVRKRYTESVSMEEDQVDGGRLGGWSWFPEMMECVIHDDFQPGNLDDLFAMLKGEGA